MYFRLTCSDLFLNPSFEMKKQSNQWFSYKVKYFYFNFISYWFSNLTRVNNSDYSLLLVAFVVWCQRKRLLCIRRKLEIFMMLGNWISYFELFGFLANFIDTISMGVWPEHDKDCGDIFPSTALEYQVLNTTVSPNTVDTLFPEYIIHKLGSSLGWRS